MSIKEAKVGTYNLRNIIKQFILEGGVMFKPKDEKEDPLYRLPHTKMV